MPQILPCEVEPSEPHNGSKIHWKRHIVANIVQYFLILGLATLSSAAEDLSRSLSEAIRNENITDIGILIQKGVDLNAIDQDGNTPIIVASSIGNKDIVDLLLTHGADVNAGATQGWTALISASKAGWTDIAEMLISHGANVNASFGPGYTPLMAASYSGNERLVKHLIKKGADVNRRFDFSKSEDNKPGVWTALTCAVIEGNAEICKILLENGADLNIVDQDGKTPLMFAKEKRMAEITEILKKHGARDEKLPDKDSRKR
jgi:ankyrin repeat protein